MNYADIRAQLEADFTWRWEEIRRLQNQLYNDRSEDEKKIFRKALIVMLYSHFEGFCKMAFSIYIDAINRKGINCADANDFIATLTLADFFDAYENRDKKCKIFKSILPEDGKLHRFARQVDFLIAASNFNSLPVRIPTDNVVDTEANLKPIVLRKILFRLGFPYNIFESKEGDIHMLLEKRNNIAHGSEKNGLQNDEYMKIENATYQVMSDLIILLMNGLVDEVFMKKTA